MMGSNYLWEKLHFQPTKFPLLNALIETRIAALELIEQLHQASCLKKRNRRYQYNQFVLTAQDAELVSTKSEVAYQQFQQIYAGAHGKSQFNTSAL